MLASLLCVTATLAAQPKPVPQDLLDGLRAAEPESRIKAIKGLSKLGVEAVPPLLGALKDSEEQVGQAAAYVLRLLKVEPKELVAALGPAIKDADVRVRRGVVGALARGGADAVPHLVAALDDAEVQVRRQAALSLQDISRRTKANDEVLAGLKKAIKDKAAPVRLVAVQALGRCGKGAAEPLLLALEDEDAPVRAYAIDSLGKIKAEPQIVLPALVRRLKEDAAPQVRQSALRTLGTLGKAAIEAIQAGLADKEPAVQNAAIKSLAALGPDAKGAVPALKELASKSPSQPVRRAAVGALGQIEEGNLLIFVELLKLPDSTVRLECLKQLGRAKTVPKEALPVVTSTLGDEDSEVRVLSAFVLGQMGAEAASAAEALGKLAKDPEPTVRNSAEKALDKIRGK